MTIRFENGQPVRTGTELQSYHLEVGHTGELEISVEAESGSVDISVFPTNAPDRFCYRGTALPTSVFTVTLAEAGEYTVQIQADRFIGSYGFAYGHALYSAGVAAPLLLLRVPEHAANV